MNDEKGTSLLIIHSEKGKELLGYVEEACNSLRIGERTMMETNNLVKGKLSIDESSLNGETKEAYKEAPLNPNKKTDKNI